MSGLGLGYDLGIILYSRATLSVADVKAKLEKLRIEKGVLQHIICQKQLDFPPRFPSKTISRACSFGKCPSKTIKNLMSIL